MLLPIRKYKKEDSDIICPVAIEGSLSQWKQWAVDNEKMGPAFTFEVDGKPVCSAGIRLLQSEETGEVIGCPWFVMSRHAKKHTLSIYESTYKMMLLIMREYGLKKLLCETKKTFKAGQRFLKHFGFKQLPAEDDRMYFYTFELN